MLVRGGVALGLFLALAIPAAADDKPLPIQIVDEFNAIYGVHPGFRANHAKGVVLEGTFTPSPGAKALTKAAHVQGPEIPITVRFSNAGGLPDAPDTHPSMLTRGMAIKFHLPSGADTDIVSISTNGFPVSNGEDFLGLLKALAATKQDSPHPTPIEQFLSTHPAAAKAVATPQPLPASYGSIPYFGVNAFKFTNTKGETVFGRYQIIPTAPVRHATEAEAKSWPVTYLADEIRGRVAKEPVKFRLLVQVANPGDPTNDATKVWPDDRKKVELGVISITKADADSLADEKKLLFVPTNVTDGIAISDDPILPLRAAAYGISFARRSAAQ
jgi:catalase